MRNLICSLKFAPEEGVHYTDLGPAQLNGKCSWALDLTNPNHLTMSTIYRAYMVITKMPVLMQNTAKAGNTKIPL